MKKRVMIVHEDTRIIWLCGQILERNGFQVIKVTEITDALKMIETGLPDLFIIDARLPDNAGIDLAKLLRTRAETALIPVIMVSNMRSVVSILRGDDLPRGVVEVSANEFVTNVESPTVLLTRVRRILGDYSQ